ncbi:hypothetical protein [Streptomyces sp. NPDC005780]
MAVESVTGEATGPPVTENPGSPRTAGSATVVPGSAFRAMFKTHDCQQRS